jgi:hypothetical protein
MDLVVPPTIVATRSVGATITVTEDCPDASVRESLAIRRTWNSVFTLREKAGSRNFAGSTDVDRSLIISTPARSTDHCRLRTELKLLTLAPHGE